MGEDPPTVPQDTDWWAAMQAAATPAEAVRHFVRGVGPLLARAAGISEILRAAALTDGEVQAIHQRHDRLQIAGYREVIDLMLTKGSLRAGLSPETATDVLLTLCGDSTYVQLTTDRGWTHDQVIDWLTEATPRVLLP